MNKLMCIVCISSMFCLPVVAADNVTESVKLKDGSVLSIDDRGHMNMFDSKGNRMTMRDGVPMETEDGRVIMMQNHALWERMPRGTLNPKFNP